MLLCVKKFSERILLPLGKKIKKVPANVITLLGFFCAGIVFIGFYLHLLLLIILFLFLTEFFDQLDGVIARLQGPTKFGAFFDSTFDRYGDFILFIGVIIGGYVDFIIGIFALMGAFMTSYTRARIEAIKGNSMSGVGLIERTDRVPILLIGAIIQIWIPTAILWTMVILACLTNLTAIQRIIYAYRKLSHQKEIENKEIND